MSVIAVVFLISAAITFMIYRRIFHKREEKNTEQLASYTLTDNEINKFTKHFITKDEKYISSLGNSYIMNFLANGNLSRGFAIISNKRVYFRGSCFNGQGKSLHKTDEERTVDIRDITGSGFIYRRYWGILLGLLSAIIVLLCGIFVNIMVVQDYQREVDDAKHPRAWAESGSDLYETYADGTTIHYYNGQVVEEDESIAVYHEQNIKKIERRASPFKISAGLLMSFLVTVILIFLNYLKKRKTLFRIEYAGGCIAFDVSFYAKAEIDDFQKQLRRAKDLVEDSAAKVTVTEPPVQASTQTLTQNSAPDDLRKYADLLKEGLISQEEYDATKKKILGL